MSFDLHCKRTIKCLYDAYMIAYVDTIKSASWQVIIPFWSLMLWYDSNSISVM